MSLLSNNTLSLYIPRVFPNVNEERVKAIFNSLDIGDVSHVDFIKKHGKDGQIYNSLYIHFGLWYNNKGAANFQENVLNPNKEAKLVYDDPWYWIVLENTSSKKLEESQKKKINFPLTTGFHLNKCDECDEFDEYFNYSEMEFVQKIEDEIQISKLDRDHTNTQLKWIEIFQKENEELKNNLKESNEELNEFREYNGKLEYMLENERTENFYLTREIGSLNGSNKNLLDELQYQILENDNLMSEIDNLKKKIESLTQK